MLIVGDVGGTKTALAFCGETSAEDPVADLMGLTTFQNRRFSGFEEILARFLEERGGQGSTANDTERISGRPTALCLGVAGVVREGACRMTNQPWHLSERALAERFDLPVLLLNDLEAAAYGMGLLSPQEQVLLNQGAGASHGNRAVISAGTGLGEAWLHWDGGRYRVEASEGGHADFAPQTDREDALLRFLRSEFGHVSYERVLSGPGLFNIYRFLREAGEAPEEASLRQRLTETDADLGLLITEAACMAGDRLCTEALSMFVSIYGAEAGNLALRMGATGGIYVGGGIAPKILPRLSDGAFMRAFFQKGQYTDWMRRISVSVACNPWTVLMGAAWVLRSTGSRDASCGQRQR